MEDNAVKRLRSLARDALSAPPPRPVRVAQSDWDAHAEEAGHYVYETTSVGSFRREYECSDCGKVFAGEYL